MAESGNPLLDGAVEWRPNSYIATGTKVVEEARVYIASRSHTSSTEFGHDLNRGLWDFVGSALLTAVDTSLLATEATLKEVKVLSDAISVSVASIDLKVATEVTLAAIKAQIDQLTFIGGRLQVQALVLGENVPNTALYNFGQSVVAQTFLVLNSDRREMYITNLATGNKNLWISFGAVAVVGQGILLEPGDVLQDDVSNAAVSGIWDGAGTGRVEIIEVLI